MDKPTLYLLGFSFIASIISIFLPKWGLHHMMFFPGFIFSAIAIGIEVYSKGIENKAEASGFWVAFVMLYLVTLAPVVICFLIPAFAIWRII